MSQDDTLVPDNLTPGQPGGENDKDKSNPSNGEGENLQNKGEFINALGEKNKKLAEKDKLLKEKNDLVEKLQEEARKRELAGMSETERLAAENAQLKQDKFVSAMKSFVVRELALRHLENHPIAEVALESVWAIPAIKRHLSTQPSWEETDKVVRQYLPEYLDSLESGRDDKGPIPPTVIPTPTPPAPTERNPSGGSDPGTKRVWQRSEIARMDIPTYAKHKKEILKAYTEGRVV